MTPTFDSPYCRLCGDPMLEAESKNIFESDAVLKFVIQVRLQIKVTPGDPFSNLACFSCVSHLRNFYRFSKKCFRVQIQLSQSQAKEIIEDVEDVRILPDWSDIDIQNTYDSMSLDENTESEDEKVSGLYDIGLKSSIAVFENYQAGIEINTENCNNRITPVLVKKPINVDHRFSSKKSLSLNEEKNFSRSKMALKVNTDHNFDVNMQLNEASVDYDSTNITTDDEEACSFSKKSDYVRRIPPKVNEDDIKCPYCSWFILKDDFEEHLSLHPVDPNSKFHQMVIKHECEVLQIKSENKSLKCTDCNKICNNELLYMEHRNFHENKYPIRCHICNRFFMSRKKLRVHNCQCHQEKVFQCDKCTHRAKTKYALKRHTEIVHTNSRIMCPICGKLIAAYSQNLTKHIGIHNEELSFKCSLCPAAYRTKSGLALHRESKHFPIPMMCSVCGILYASRAKYRRHQKKCKKRHNLLGKKVL